MPKLWVPVAISDVKITCHEQSVTDIPEIQVEKVQGCLVAVRVHIDDKANILFIVECYEVYVMMVDYVQMQSKLEFRKTLIDIHNYSRVVVL